MAKRKEKSKHKRNLIDVRFVRFIWREFVFLVKIPYYLVLGIIWFVKKVFVFFNERKISKKRERMYAAYVPFEVIKTIKGDFKEWENHIQESDSTIGIIIGARGSGKSAVGLKMLENIYANTKRKTYAIGFHNDEMPSWIEVVRDINDVRNNSFVLIDEGGVLFNSRDSMKSANKMLSELIFVSRHKNLSILFISQNSANLEINILRQADYLVLKHSSLLQKDFERKIIQKIYEETAEEFERYSNKKGLSYIHSSEFRGFVTNELPSFWKQSISKSFSEVRVENV